MANQSTLPVRKVERLLGRADRLSSWARAHSYLTAKRVPPRRRTPSAGHGR